LPAKRYDLGEDSPVPMRNVPVSITSVEIGGSIMVDPSLDEESIAGTNITVTLPTRKATYQPCKRAGYTP